MDFKKLQSEMRGVLKKAALQANVDIQKQVREQVGDKDLKPFQVVRLMGEIMHTQFHALGESFSVCHPGSLQESIAMIHALADHVDTTFSELADKMEKGIPIDMPETNVLSLVPGPQCEATGKQVVQ